MSMEIDQRIVEMRFDNKQFEQNVSTTLSTLDKLKQKLHLDGASKGLENLNSAAKNVDMSTLSNNVDKVGLRFNALYTIADQALRNITNSAMHYGKKIVSALTIDPIKTGFKEYETQINAIQTILANTESKGTTLDDVNKALDELNLYADKTIYNFTEMTRNIGTFTAAGVDLDTSVSAIKGIANLAAVSGSTSQQASTAMYQLSQALASGTVKLMDWNSVVNAGMGGQVFQDALKETARVHGIAIDEMIKDEGSFRETLSNGWLSSEILTETLSKFTGDLNAEQLKSMGYADDQIEAILKLGQTANDAATKVKTFTQLFDTLKEAAQSGWTSTWEIIVGDFNEAKELLTKISDTIGGMLGESAAARNDLLENWKVLGGRTELIDAIKYAFEGIMSIMQAVSEAAKEVFPQATAEGLVAFCKRLRELTQAFAESFKVNGKTTETFNNLKRTLAGVFAVVNIVRQVVVALFKALGIVLGATGKLSGGLLSITAVIGDWLVALNDALEYSGIFEGALTGLANVVKFVIGIFTNFARSVSDSFIFQAAIEGLNAFLGLIVASGDEANKFAQAGKNIKDAWVNSGLYSFLVKVWEIVKTIGDGIKKTFSGVFDALGAGDFETVFDFVNGILSGGLLIGLTKLVKSIYDLFSGSGGIFSSLNRIADGVDELLGKVGDTFQAFQDKLKADALKSIATAILTLVGALVILSFIDEEALSKALAGITLLMTMITIMLKVMTGSLKGGIFTVFNPTGYQNIAAMAFVLGKVASAILIMSAAIMILGRMDEDALWRGATVVALLLGEMVVMQAAMAKVSEGGSVKNATSILAMAASILLLTTVMDDIAAMSWEDIGKSLTAITVILASLGGVQILYGKLAGGAGRMLAGAVAISIMAVSLSLLVPILTVFAMMPLLTLIKSVTAVLVLLASLAGVQVLYGQLGNGWSNMSSGAAAIAVMAKSLNELIPILLIFAIVPWISLIQSISALIVLLGALGGVQILYGRLAGGTKNMLAGAGAISIIATSLNLLLPFLLIIADMHWAKLLQSVSAMVVLLAALSGAMVLYGQLGGGASTMLAGAGAIAIMAASLVVLAGALKIVGSMSIDQTLVALGTLAVALLGIVYIAYQMTPIIGTITAFASSINLVGVGILAAGAGLVLFGVALSTVALGIVELIGALTALVGAMGTVAIGLIVLVAAFIEGIIVGIGRGIVALCEVLIKALPLIADVCVELVGMICDVLIGCAPKIVDTIFILILEVCEGLAKYVPPIVAALVRLVTGIISAFAQELPGLMQAVVELLFAFVEGIISALGGLDTSRLMDALMSTNMLTIIMGELALMTLLAPPAMLGVLAMAAVLAELAVVLAAFGAINKIPGLQDLISGGGSLLESIGTSIGKFIGGLAGGFASGATKDLPEIGKNLSAFAREIGDFVDIAPKLGAAISALSGAGLDTAWDSLWTFGGSSFDKIAGELPKIGKAMAGFKDEIGERTFSNVQGAVDGALAISGVVNALPPKDVLQNKIGETFVSDFETMARGIVAFSDEVSECQFTNVGAAVDAARSLAEIADIVPNEGGIVAWFTGENSLSKFGTNLIKLGEGISGFAAAVNGTDMTYVPRATEAAKALVDLTNKIPNEGGMVSWFAGDNSISKFSGELGKLGKGVKSFAEGFGDTNPDTVKNAAEAAKDLVDMTNKIPNEGGMVAWFAGESSISKFGGDLGALGAGIKAFSTNTEGITPETVEAAAKAATMLAEMTTHIPNEGGVKSWFVGESSVSKFGTDLGNLGAGIKAFSTNTEGITPETVEAAAKAAVSLAEMTSHIPNEGGIKSWFAGETSVAKFGEGLGALGTGIKTFATNTEGITPETVKAAAEAGVSLAEMTEAIPPEKGIKAWFAGEVNVAKFAENLPGLGSGIAGFAKAFSDVDESGMAKIGPAAEAGKVLAAMMDAAPKEGGIKAWFAGETNFADFAEDLSKVGEGIAGFANSLGDADMTKVEPAANAGKTLAEMTDTVPKNSNRLGNFGENIASFGSNLASFITKVNEGVSETAINAAKSMVDIAKDVAAINSGNIKAVASQLYDFAEAAADMAAEVNEDMKTAGKQAIEGYIKAINDKISDAETKSKVLAQACANALAEKSSLFETPGKQSVQGFANGMSKYSYLAEDAAWEVGRAALRAMQEAIDSNSPSKETDKLGQYGGMGFVNGLLKYIDKSADAGYEMGISARDGIRNAVDKIGYCIDHNIDTEPTIRPVLDLRDVEAKAGLLGGMFGGTSIGVRANIGAINSMMNSRNQNGTNSDIIKALNELRDDLSNVGNTTYQINGVTYDDGSNIKDAVSTLIRAARIERRV